MLHKDRVLKILVGHEGSRDPLDPHRPGGGGGGTFVVYEDGKPLLVAGGGGGGGIPKASKYACACYAGILYSCIYTRNKIRGPSSRLSPFLRNEASNVTHHQLVFLFGTVPESLV